MRDLRKVLRGLDPELRPGRFVFVSVPIVPDEAEPVATVVEAEGVSMVIPAERADALELHYDVELAMITLGVHSAIDAVGLTAAVSAALADAGIACNVVAGYHHDHLFVSYGHAEQSVATLSSLEGPA